MSEPQASRSVTPLPPDCEKPLLHRFVCAEAMALRAVRSAQLHAPPSALAFLKRHEEEEQVHLKTFEGLTGTEAREQTSLPEVPRQWHALAVQLLGYEALGLEFARLLVGVRPDLSEILEDEEVHVAYFEGEVRKIVSGESGLAAAAREFARAWLRRLPRTIGRYLRGPELEPHREGLSRAILGAIEERFTALGLLDGAAGRR